MSTVGIRELKNRLSYYLSRMKQGEEIVVTERGKPIAIIQPIESAKAIASLEAKLAGMAAQGLIDLPEKAPLEKIRLVQVSGVPTSKVVVEDRR